MDNSLYSMGENTSKQPEKERNNSENLKQDSMALDDLKSELLDPLEEKPSKIDSGSIKTIR